MSNDVTRDVIGVLYSAKMPLSVGQIADRISSDGVADLWLISKVASAVNFLHKRDLVLAVPEKYGKCRRWVLVRP